MRTTVFHGVNDIRMAELERRPRAGISEVVVRITLTNCRCGSPLINCWPTIRGSSRQL